MSIKVEGRFYAGLGVLDAGIDRLEFVENGSGLTLISGSGRNGGLATYGLDALAPPVLVDLEVFDGGWIQGLSDVFAVVNAPDGGLEIVVGSAEFGKVSAFSFTENGQIGTHVTYDGLGASFGRSSAISGDGGILAFVSQEGALAWARRDAGGDLVGFADIPDETISYDSFVTAAAQVTLGGADILVVGDAGSDGIKSYVLGADTATLVTNLGKADGSGMMDPTQVAIVEVLGDSFVIASSATDNSGALSVFLLEPDGSLTRTDHVIDNGFTRFGGVTSLATVEVDGRQFVAAGGADDGVTLFVVMPGGTLQYLETIVNNWVGGGPGQVAIANVSAIAAGLLNDRIRIIVASQAESGLSDLSWDVSGQGAQFLADNAGEAVTGGGSDDLLVGRAGDDAISGGGGDDILVDGKGEDVLTGGAGADVFVLRDDGQRDVIIDFDPSVDRLDLSSWPFFYVPQTLTILPNADGAEVTWRDETLMVRSANGGTLAAHQIRGAVMTTPDRPMDLSGYSFPDDPTGGDDGGGGGDDDPEPYDFKDTDGDDLIDGTGNADTILIGAGDDEVHAGGGNDQVDGGFGRNRVFLDAGDDSYDDLGQSGSADGDNVHGGAGDDTIRTGASADEIDGGSGDDVIHAGAGHDDVTGGAGSDEAYLGDGNDRYFDSLGEGPGENDIVFGGGGNDYIVTGGGNDQLYGEDGNDTLGGKTGHDLIDAGDGADQAYGASGNDEIYGRAGADTLYGGAGDDILDGGGDDDALHGEAGLDLIRGGDGHDWIHGGADNDTLDGGAGNDVLIGDTGEDRLEGGAGVDVLNGNAGDDILDGGAGNDRLYGGAGHDEIHGGHDMDRLFGHGGNDRMYGDADRDVMFGHAGRDRLYGGDGYDRVIGGQHDDVLFGNAGNDVLLGQDGNDRLCGQQDDDILNGGGGHDKLYGASGNDRLIGGGGNDLLVAGSGTDTLIGGAGRDRFIFTQTSGENFVRGFNLRQDRLLFRGIDKSDVSISKAGPHVTVEWDEGSVVLVNHDGRGFWFDDINFS
ncbi:calcium-binding protein [Maritimibacter dapengensis]|uniref:Ca2+-binding protein, RTX toxin-related n=1 Tax=Maritimibacter dapengensis TaxID=2836868 RepID=A0ABS6T644_9RHOB|nr:hypothetical protein [Maritimibacter dapengensis]